LQDGLLRLAGRFNDPELGKYRQRFGRDTGRSEPAAATVFLFESTGFSPVKEEMFLPIPGEDGIITKVAFARFVPRSSALASSELVARNGQGLSWHMPTELGIDITDIAMKDLDSRKALALAKGILRPGLKYLIEHNQQKVIEKKQGETAAGLFGLASSLYNLFSEKADLRSWQSLPGQIRVARLSLLPGRYRLSAFDMAPGGVTLARDEVAEIDLQPGRTYFIVRRILR
jgi:hypothetical protein